MGGNINSIGKKKAIFQNEAKQNADKVCLEVSFSQVFEYQP
jgi:hypothetical protein